MDKIYALSITLPAWRYIRQVLGTRPYDEVGPLIQALEQSVAEQDQAEQAMAQEPGQMIGKSNGSAQLHAEAPE